MSFLWRLQLGFARFTPSADLRRKLCNGLAFAAGGLVACGSAVALIVPSIDAAPHYVPPSAAAPSAYVLAPAPSQLRPINTPAVASVLPVVDTAPTAKFVAAAPKLPAPVENPVVAYDKPAAAEPAAVVASAPAVEEPVEAAPPVAKPRKKVRRQRDRHPRDSAFWSSYGYDRGYSRQNSFFGLFR